MGFPPEVPSGENATICAMQEDNVAYTVHVMDQTAGGGGRGAYSLVADYWGGVVYIESIPNAPCYSNLTFVTVGALLIRGR